MELMDERQIPYFATDIQSDMCSIWDIRKPFPYDVKLGGIIHLAGVLGTHELFDQVNHAIDVNIKGTVNVLDIARKQRIPFRGITMDHVWVNPYETTKLAAERLAQAWGREYGFNVTYTTVYNAYGPYQAYGLGHPQKIIPTFIMNALQNKPLPIWGDGNQIVDLIHAKDVARTLLAPTGFDGGRGIPLSVIEVARIVWSIANKQGEFLKVEYLPMRMGEHKPDRPPVARWPIAGQVNLDAGLLETIQWYKKILK